MPIKGRCKGSDASRIDIGHIGIPTVELFFNIMVTGGCGSVLQSCKNIVKIPGYPGGDGIEIKIPINNGRDKTLIVIIGFISSVLYII